MGVCGIQHEQRVLPWILGPECARPGFHCKRLGRASVQDHGLSSKREICLDPSRSARCGATDEARARCCLGLAQLEQESLDHGSAILSQEMSLEPPAPVSSFQVHTLPDPVEMPHTRLLDSRWVDAFAHKIKEVDNFVELRRKLGQRPKAAPSNPNQGGGKASGKTKGKAGGKGKHEEAQHQGATEHVE